MLPCLPVRVSMLLLHRLYHTLAILLNNRYMICFPAYYLHG